MTGKIEKNLEVFFKNISSVNLNFYSFLVCKNSLSNYNNKYNQVMSNNKFMYSTYMELL